MFNSSYLHIKFFYDSLGPFIMNVPSFCRARNIGQFYAHLSNHKPVRLTGPVQATSLVRYLSTKHWNYHYLNQRFVKQNEENKIEKICTLVVLNTVVVRRWTRIWKVVGSKPSPCKLRITSLGEMWTQLCLSPPRSINGYRWSVAMSTVCVCILLCKKDWGYHVK